MVVVVVASPVVSIAAVAEVVEVAEVAEVAEVTDMTPEVLFKIIESLKTIERVDKVSWAEEVHNLPSKETTISSFQESINSSVQHNNTNESNRKETAP